MKTSSKYLLIAASVCGAALILAGCQKNDVSAAVGTPISFSAKSGLNKGVTKTSYSGEGNKDEKGNLTYERINWEKGDIIMIASDKATDRYNTNEHFAEYMIKDPVANGVRSEASISNTKRNSSGEISEGGNGLVWGEGEHKFWGIYPSAAINLSSDNATATVSGLTISPAQKLTNRASDETKTVLQPNMQQAYMLAALKASKPSGKKIELEFYPAFTALEFTLQSKYENTLEIRSFTLTSKDTKLAGSFDVTSINDEGKSTFSISDNASTAITVDFKDNGYPTVTKTKALTFTVLALPQDLKNLTIDFTIIEKGASGDVETHRKLDLSKKGTDGKYEFVTFKACRKSRIYGLAMPSGELLLSYDVNPWEVASEIEFESSIKTVLRNQEPYKKYNRPQDEGLYEWGYIMVSSGYQNKENQDIDAPTSKDDRPKYSRRIELQTTVKGGTILELHLDNPKFKFIEYDDVNGFNHDLNDVITIEPDAEGKKTTFFYVVPKETFKVDASETEKICHVYLTTVSTSVAAIRLPFNSASLPGGSDDSSEIWFYYIAPALYDTTGEWVE